MGSEEIGSIRYFRNAGVKLCTSLDNTWRYFDISTKASKSYASLEGLDIHRFYLCKAVKVSAFDTMGKMPRQIYISPTFLYIFRSFYTLLDHLLVLEMCLGSEGFVQPRLEVRVTQGIFSPKIQKLCTHSPYISITEKYKSGKIP